LPKSRTIAGPVHKKQSGDGVPAVDAWPVTPLPRRWSRNRTRGHIKESSRPSPTGARRQRPKFRAVGLPRRLSGSRVCGEAHPSCHKRSYSYPLRNEPVSTV
jgi:hypothetical protein